MEKPTREELAKYLKYDPESGAITWWRSRHGTKGAGSRAGKADESTNGYRVIGFFGDYYRASHIAWVLTYGEWPSMIDHINGDRADDRIDNLRESSPRENALNTEKHRNGHLAGTHQTRTGAWRSQIVVNGKHYHLGTFATAEDAHKEYLDARARFGV